MAFKDRRAKAIDVGSHGAPAPEADCRGGPKLAADSILSAHDIPQEQGSNLPGWMRERHGEATKGIPRQDAERP